MLKQENLQKVILDYYSGMYSSKLKILVIDLEGKILFVSSVAAKLFGINPYHENLDAEIKRAFFEMVPDPAIQEEIKKIRPLVLETQDLISFFINLPVSGINHSFVFLVRAIFAQNAEPIGIEVIIDQYAFFPLKHHLRHPQEKTKSENFQTAKIKLTEREYLVLFYLVLGYTQDEVADILQVTRGTVARMIHDKLYEKFGPAKRTTDYLIEAAIKNGVKMNLPTSISHGFKLVKL